MKRIFVLLFCLVFAGVLSSQIYPVQISAQLVPPYSGYLPDYADPSAEKLKVILQFNDFSQAQYNVRLKFEIKGNGFTLSTKTLFNPPPITILPGQPLLLSGNDLAPYLNTNNLDFIGINQSQYQQKMALPEGYYSICIKAYDYYNQTPIQISNEACAQAWFTLSDPPYLNLPICNTAITPLIPQNVIFQWTPVNMASPNSAFNTEYEFSLYECRPDSTVNPNQLVLSASPIFSTTTQQTFYNYTMVDPPLNLYMKYVWRVRAKDITGRDLFKNNGYSQICTFTYGTIKNIFGNTLGLTLTARELTHRSGECTWTKQSVYSSYMLQVRKKNTNYWFNFPNSTGLERVPNLEPKTIYECRVRGEGAFTGEWSNIAEFKTLDPPTYSCNDNSLAPFNNLAPLPPTKAVVGLVIQSGQFEVVATQIQSTGQPGWYKGKGYALVFGGIPVAVEWKNIFVDAEQRQQQGIIEAMTKGVDKWLNEWDVKEAEENAIYANGHIDSVYMNGNQICYALQGNSTPVCVPTPTGVNVVVVRDADGNQWNIQLMPPPPKITGPTNYLNFSDDNLDATDNLKVVFEAESTQNFGFDKKEYAAFIDNYEAIKLAGNKTYFVPNKSIGESASDAVIATFTLTGYSQSQLSFKTKGGTAISTIASGNNLKLTGIPANAECVYAYVDNKKIGKLNVVSLKQITKKLVIVKVNQANITLSASDLNNIYKQANVTWSLAPVETFTFDLGTNGLEAADANLLSKYSSEMRALRDTYKQTHSNYDKDAYYVFVVPNFTDVNLKGYMVRGRALGFVKDGVNPKDIAHELAHGAFGLEHTFPGAQKESTNNLLDYGNGIILFKEQWNIVQDPGTIINWLDNEEDGSLNANSGNCDPNAVPINLRNLAQSAIACASDFDTKMNAYNGQGQLLAGLCLDQRINILKCLATGRTGYDDEISIIDVIRYTPPLQRAPLLVALKKTPSLLSDIISSVDGDEFYTLIGVLSAITCYVNPAPDLVEANVTGSIKTKHIIFFDDLQGLKQYVNTDGTIDLKTRKNFTIGWDQELSHIDPFSHVFFRFDANFSQGNNYFPVGYCSYLPAIYCYGLFNESNNRKVRLFVDGVLLIVGIGEIEAAVQTGKGLTLAILDAGVAASDLIITNVLVDKLNSSESGKIFLHRWNMFAMCYGGVRAGPLILKHAKNLYIAGKKFLNTSPNITQNEFQQIDKVIDEAKRAVNEIEPNGSQGLDNFILNGGKTLDEIVDEGELILISKEIKYLPGPQLPPKISSTFDGGTYLNRKLISNETFYKYHGVDNRTGRKFGWYTNKKYLTEIELRQKLAIRDDWGVKIEFVSEFDVPSGTWISEGKAAAQGPGYPGLDYQAVIMNTPNSWVIKTNKAFN